MNAPARPLAQAAALSDYPHRIVISLSESSRMTLSRAGAKSWLTVVPGLIQRILSWPTAEATPARTGAVATAPIKRAAARDRHISPSRFWAGIGGVTGRCPISPVAAKAIAGMHARHKEAALIDDLNTMWTLFRRLSPKWRIIIGSDSVHRFRRSRAAVCRKR